MQKKIAGLVLAATLIAPLAVARAAETLHFRADGRFANVNKNEPSGASTSVFVSTEDQAGRPVYRIFFAVSDASGASTLGSGLLPAGAFHSDATGASLDVDINAMTLEFQIGEIPANGVISIDWDATGVQRMTGRIVSEFEGGRVSFTGNAAEDQTADAEGDVFGVPLVEPEASLRMLHQNTIVIFFNN